MVDLATPQDREGKERKEKKEKKEKKDKSGKEKKDKKDKDKKDKKDKKEKKERKSHGDDGADEDSDAQEAKRQKTGSATPAATPSAPVTPTSSGPASSEATPKPLQPGDPDKKEQTEDEKKKDEQNNNQKAESNRRSLENMTLNRASTADVAEMLQAAAKQPGSSDGTTTPALSDIDQLSETKELTDQQKVARHNHLNRFARSLKSTILRCDLYIVWVLYYLPEAGLAQPTSRIWRAMHEQVHWSKCVVCVISTFSTGSCRKRFWSLRWPTGRFLQLSRIGLC